MPIYIDKFRNTYYCLVFYINYFGERKRKMKRGFKTLEDAKEWETDFHEKLLGFAEMPFDRFIPIYLRHISLRVDQSTYLEKELIIGTHITPYFTKRKINSILPFHIFEWQNYILEKQFSNTYNRKLNDEIDQIFKLAEIMFNLPINPCSRVKKIGSKKTNRNAIMGESSFKSFIKLIDNQELQIIFSALYLTGMRFGELMALTPNDIDSNKNIISVTKSLRCTNGTKTLKDPKSECSYRKIVIPKNLTKMLHEASASKMPDELIFSKSKYAVHRALKKACKDINLPNMRVHDFRHSHASYLLQNNVSIVEV